MIVLAFVVVKLNRFMYSMQCSIYPSNRWLFRIGSEKLPSLPLYCENNFHSWKKIALEIEQESDNAT